MKAARTSAPACPEMTNGSGAAADTLGRCWLFRFGAPRRGRGQVGMAEEFVEFL